MVVVLPPRHPCTAIDPECRRRRYIADQDVSAAWNVKMKERNSTSGMQQDSAAARRAQAELGSEQAERLGTL